MCSCDGFVMLSQRLTVYCCLLSPLFRKQMIYKASLHCYNKYVENYVTC